MRHGGIVTVTDSNTGNRMEVSTPMKDTVMFAPHDKAVFMSFEDLEKLVDMLREDKTND